MEHIVYIEFGKSRSAKIEKMVTLVKELPGFEKKNEMYSIQVDTIKEYLINYEKINELIDTVRFWKHSTVMLYGNSYKNYGDYYNFQKELERNAGEYAIILKNRDSVKIESLPLPIVFYPRFYGAFLAFAADIGEQIYFVNVRKELLTIILI